MPSPSRGAKPGERRAGRQTGSKNKATLERERLALEALQGTATKRDPKRKLSKEALSDGLQIALGMAAKYQPSIDTAPGEKKFRDWLEFAMRIAERLAPYEHPRYSTVTIVGDPLAPVQHVIHGMTAQQASTAYASSLK